MAGTSMRLPDWFLPSRRLLAMFAGVILVPAVALGWLAWRTLDQDCALERHRTEERLQRSADLLAATLQGRLRVLPEQVPGLFATVRTVPEDSLLISSRGGAPARRKRREVDSHCGALA